MRVAVFRAAEDGARTAARLADLGHAPVLAPVLRIARTDVAIACNGVGAIVFTSGHAAAVLTGDPALPRLRGLPCWCVGSRTAGAARAQGFTRIESGPGDSARLAETLRARLPEGTPLLLLVGRDRKPTLETELRQSGFDFRIAEVYHAAAVPSWDAATVDRLTGCEAALHYSRRSAELALGLAGAHDLLGRMRDWRHHCLSGDVAEALRPLGPAYLRCADQPDEASLVATLSPR